MKVAKTPVPPASVRAMLVMLAALSALPAPVQAQQLAYVSTEVNLRAGPSSDYPVVAILGAGVNITVEGCMSDYRWCDVSVGSNRGWLHAGNIVYPHQGVHVPLLTYGSAIGIGVIGFSLGNYWDDYYRHRPWYPQRQRWIDRHHHPFPHSAAHPVPYPVPSPALRPGFQHPPGVHPGYRPHDHSGVRHEGGHRPPSQVLVPGSRPLGPRPGLDQRPPPAVHPIQGPVLQNPHGVPRAHHGMRRHEGQRPGEAHGHGAERHP